MVPFSSLFSTHSLKMRHMTIFGLIFYQISVPITMAAILDSRVIWTTVQWARLPAFSMMPPIKISTLSPNLLSFSFCLTFSVSMKLGETVTYSILEGFSLCWSVPMQYMCDSWFGGIAESEVSIGCIFPCVVLATSLVDGR